jgi:hypothetical protein
MSEVETPKTKKPRSAPKSLAQKFGEMAAVKRKQMERLNERRIKLRGELDEADVAFKSALDELNKLEAAAGIGVAP